MGMSKDGLKDLSRDECLDLLATVSVGRLGVSIAALPAIFPVNFTLHQGAVVVRSAPGTKLDAALRHNVVAFEADCFSPDGSSGWSVLVRGVASAVEDPDVLAALRGLPLRSWALPTEANCYILIATTAVSGRRFDHSDSAPVAVEEDVEA
jgi:uncharacterized protein